MARPERLKLPTVSACWYNRDMSVRSHTIPRAYLERFATPRRNKPGRIWVYEKGKEAVQRSTRSQGYEKGYFEFVHLDGRKDESMEPALGRIEDDCLDALVSARSALCDLSLVNVRLATYMAMLFRRATVSRKANARRWSDIAEPYARLASNQEYVRDIADYWSKHLRHEFTREDIEKMIRDQSTRLADKTFTKNNFIRDLMMFIAIGKREMLKKFWQVWHAPNGIEFVTSDNPVVTFVRAGAQQEVWVPGFGFGYNGVVVGFPLAPDACLVMFGKPQPTDRKNVDPSTVIRMNGVVISCCDRFVYSRARSDEVSETVNQTAATSVPGVNAFMGRTVDENLVEDHMRRMLGAPKVQAENEKQTTPTASS